MARNVDGTRIPQTMHNDTTDTRGLDLYPALREEADTVAVIVGITTARRDNVVMTPADLTILGSVGKMPWIDSNDAGFASTTINWWQTVGAVAVPENGVDYVITVAFTTTAGRELKYSALQRTSAHLG